MCQGDPMTTALTAALVPSLAAADDAAATLKKFGLI